MSGNHTARICKFLMSAVCAAAVVGCSSEGGSGGGDEGTDRTSNVSAESTLNQSNLHQVSQSAMQAAETAVNVDMGVAATNEVFGLGGQFSSTNIGNGSDIYASTDASTSMMRSVASSDRNAEFLGLIPVELLSFLCTNGSISAIDPLDVDTLGIKFNDCTMDGLYIDGQATQLQLDGEAYLTISNSGDEVSVGYNNFWVAWLDKAYDLGSMSLTCTGITTGEFNCDADIVEMLGADGREYLLSEVSLLGDALSGYDIDALLNDPLNGSYEVSSDAITFNCDNGHPDSGSLMVTAEDGSSASISFPSCSEYTVCMDDVCDTQTWSF